MKNKRISIKNKRIPIKNKRISIKNKRISIKNKRISIKNERISIKNNRISIKNKNNRRTTTAPSTTPPIEFGIEAPPEKYRLLLKFLLKSFTFSLR